MKKYIKNYPRPQFIREDWENLNGEWNFIFDDNNEGESRKYYNNFPTKNKINVPYTYETQLSGINDTTVHYIVWYNKKVQLLKSEIENKKVLLHFEGSDYITKVWVNGNYIGKNIGGYSRFSFDISEYIIDGENDITVRVEDSLSKSQPRGKQRYKKESWKCWYVQTTGIWKTVWLEYVSNKYLKSIKNTPNFDNETITLEVETNILEKDYEKDAFYIETQISYDGAIVNTNRIQLVENNQKIELPICNENTEHSVKVWSPENPNLYDIEYRLYHEEKVIDTIYSYFGVRKISIKGNKIFLNNNELYQKLILDQGYWKESHLTPPNEEALIKDIDYVLKFGYNGVRKHQKVEDEKFLYWCDVKGVLVWGEMANCYEFNDSSLEGFSSQWIKVVKQNYNHPSIITWVPINESWGVPEVKNNIKQQNFINSLYYITKSIDNTRPVIANDGWEHTISDIITIHDYKQDAFELNTLYNENKEKILGNIEQYNSKHSLFAGNYKYDGRPVIMSEYGGTALNLENGWGYGKQVSNENEFIERFQNLTNTIKNIPYFAGYCYTQLTDVQQEINGLIDENRNFKFSEKINELIKITNTHV